MTSKKHKERRRMGSDQVEEEWVDVTGADNHGQFLPQSTAMRGRMMLMESSNLCIEKEMEALAQVIYRRIFNNS